MPPPPPAPVPLFSTAPSLNLVNNAKLQTALNDAVKAVTVHHKTPNFAITIVDLGTASADGKSYASAGYHEDKEYYAASMIKAACLYAAYNLLDLVTRFNAARKPKSPDELFQLLTKELDPQINTCCPMITGRAAAVRLPRWRDVFSVTGTAGALSIRFTPTYDASLEGMIVPSNNEDAGRCIRGVGYAYLNGLMLKHGFFDSSSKTGIWLAGDYGNSEVVTIDTENDGDTKQGTTTAAFARLGLIFLETTLPGKDEMLGRLKRSSRSSDGSYFTRPNVTNHLTHDQVIFGKIGYGPLKSGVHVLSDLNLISNPLLTGGNFIVCWVNIDQITYYTAHVLWTFLETVSTYQSAASSAAAAPAAATVGATAH